ncbi:MAG: TRAP transporter large permease subunit, partial [Pseudomonadota bacterium]|nr:TRAP transporter large permease subunit [Pseudomonadota bacterium]
FIAVRALINPRLAPADTTQVTARARMRSLLDIVPLFALILFVMGSIYLGWATATEAAAIGVVASFAIAAMYRGLSWDNIRQAHMAA